jgi:phenylacetate-CoA oxygenase PaaH subunit
MDVYEVFQRKGAAEPMVHVGSVNASDTRMALVLAKECFFRREHPSDLWVVRRDDLHPLHETDVLGPGTDKSYRSIEAYKGLAKKRDQIEASLQ